jgi:hypothetical protein
VPAQQARELAWTEGNLPLLVESSAGRGRCVLVAVPADNQWGNWAVKRLYLPFIHQLMGYLTDRLPEFGRVRVEPVGSSAGHAPGVVIEDGNAIVRNIDPAESSLERISPARLREIYRLPVAHSFMGKRDSDTDEPPPGSERPDELWAWIACALLAVLVVETFVANRTYT